MEESVNERIKTLAEIYSDKSSDFARVTELTNQNVYDLITGRKGAPSFATIKKILIAFPLVSERWLLLGEGEMFKHTSSLSVTDLRLKAASNVAANDLKLIDNLIDVNKIYSFLEVRMLLEAAYTQGLSDGINHADSSKTAISDSLTKEEVTHNQKVDTPYSSDSTLTPVQWAEVTSAVVRSIMDSEEMKDRMAVAGAVGRANAEAEINIYWIGKPDPNRPFNGLLTERLNISEEEARELILSGQINAKYMGHGKQKRITSYRVSERAVQAFLNKN